MIRSEKLRYSYTVWENETESKRTALADVDLDIGKGEFVVILGRNGSGKSTFAKHLNAILVPDSGSVLIDGKNTSERALVKAIRDLVGMTFQNPDNQIIGTSVEEDVAFGPEQRNVAPEEIRSRVESGLRSVGLLEKRKASPFRLSGGQKQRLAIAGTLAADTDCIVLDEPTAMLDPSARREVIAILHRLHSQGKTIILITHHTDEALGADRIVIMNGGQV
ncbi:MAG: ATP-binding cassette domain-containing protein, partial [Mogibacterium sp.]|nr:ATP-binding cassette domain-containing protein [Mogibacterium sp.]